MLSRIHDKLGTAGLIVAVVALVAALAGTAFAAAGLNSTQKKEVKKIAKKFAGKPGATGPTGPQGPKGDTGAAGKDGTNGTNGTDGTNGKSVVLGTAGGECIAGGVTVQVEGSGTKKAICNGENGQTGFTETLPSGKTETGVLGFRAVGGRAFYSAETETVLYSDSEAILEPLTFNIPLSEAPEEVIYLKPAETNETDCPGGTPETPKAAPGKLCIYAEGSIYNEETNPEGVQFFTALKLAKSGAVLFFLGHGRNKNLYGTWAVTAK